MNINLKKLVRSEKKPQPILCHPFVDKAVKVIESCHSFEQLLAAKKYCCLALNFQYPEHKDANVDYENFHSRRTMLHYFIEKLAKKAADLNPYFDESEIEVVNTVWSN